MDNQATAQPTQTFRCNQCGQIFLNRSLFIRHERTQHKEEPNDIPSPPSTSNLQDVHISQSRTAENENTCDICDSQLVSERYLIIHIERFHKAEMPFKCIQCGKRFSQSSDLEEHRKPFCPGEVAYKCGMCAAEYTTEGRLMRHTRDVHNGVDASFECEICHAGFHLEVYLRRHKKYMHNVTHESLYCEFCREKITRKSDLERHRNGLCCIDGRKSHKCVMCDAEFSTEALRQRHTEEAHADELHRCEYCGRGFARLEYVKRHTERMHIGDLQFKCEFCGEKFAQVSDLVIHQKRVCTGDKPFVCGICNKTFFNMYTLTRHAVNLHGGMLFQCDVPRCGARFSALHDLEEHHRWFHREGMPSTSEGRSSKFTLESILNSPTVQSQAEEEEDSFNCELCGEVCADEADLTEHIVMHTVRLFD